MFLNRLAYVLWPARCPGCNTFVSEGVAFCPACDVSVVPLGACCPGCAMPLDGADACAGCENKPFTFARATAALAYGGALTQALLRWKHGGHRHIVRPLSRFLRPLLARAGEQGAELVCPVPLHPRRLRQRGFNQALDLVLAARGRASRIHIVCDVLQRKVDTPTLGHGSPAERRRLVANAFAVARPKQVQDRRVVVVDDVMTTGATLAECARVLLEAGASEVTVLALARAI